MVVNLCSVEPQLSDIFQIVVANCKRKVGVATSVLSTFKYIMFLFSVSSFYVLFPFCHVYC
jgi:hypothetical protein